VAIWDTLWDTDRASRASRASAASRASLDHAPLDHAPLARDPTDRASRATNQSTFTKFANLPLFAIICH
jgi:hypothetical protein